MYIHTHKCTSKDLVTCISFFCIAIIKYHDQKQQIEWKFYLGLHFQREREHSHHTRESRQQEGVIVARTTHN